MRTLGGAGIRAIRPVPFGLLAAALLLLGGLPAPPAGAVPASFVHAHRGGPLETVNGEQVPRFAENTRPAFRAAAKAGYVLELDVKLTSDNVPVVIHDATLDRTTDCTGQVAAKTRSEIEACEVDILGTSGNFVELEANDPRRSRVPALADVLAVAKRKGSTVNLEIKNVPTDPDFDPGVPPAFARTVAAAIKESRFPPSRLIVQSFWPANLDVIEDDPDLAGAETSLLTLQQMNEGGPAFAAANGYEWVSPGWPVGPAYVGEAHALGLEVVPYTLDSPQQIEDAAGQGVDAVISNDPGMARRVLGGRALR